MRFQMNCITLILGLSDDSCKNSIVYDSKLCMNFIANYNSMLMWKLIIRCEFPGTILCRDQECGIGWSRHFPFHGPKIAWEGESNMTPIGLFHPRPMPTHLVICVYQLKLLTHMNNIIRHQGYPHGFKVFVTTNIIIQLLPQWRLAFYEKSLCIAWTKSICDMLISGLVWTLF